MRTIIFTTIDRRNGTYKVEFQEANVHTFEDTPCYCGTVNTLSEYDYTLTSLFTANHKVI